MSGSITRDHAAPPGERRTGHVLLVEDSPTQAAAVRRMLEEAGYAVRTAPDGNGGLRMVTETGPDLVLSDVDMPGMDGFELCRQVKQDPATAGTPFVMLTHRDRLTDLVRALEVGADNYVTKPINPEILLSRVGYLIELGGAARRPDGRRAGAMASQRPVLLERGQIVEVLRATAQKIEHELSTLREVGAMLTMNHELDALLALFAERVRSLADAQGVVIALREGGAWRVRAVDKAQRLAAADLAGLIAGDQGLLPRGEVSAMAEPLHVRYGNSDRAAATGDSAGRFGLLQCYSWPLVHDGELKGRLLLLYAHDRELTADEHRRFRHLADQAAIAVVNAQLFEQERALHRQLEQALTAEREIHRDAMLMVAGAAEARDGFTGTHLRRVQAYAEAIAGRLAFPADEVDEIGYSSVLHDIGKLLVPDRVLGKPGKLSDDEWVEMRRHTELGAQLLSVRESFGMARDIAWCHHERWDGSGYPRGLHGEDIPLAARITSVADVYDALVTRRPYKEPWSDTDAIAEIRALSGRSFDPAIVAVFSEMWQERQIAAIRDRFAEG